MEDDKIKLFFENFEPELSPDAQFLKRLDDKLNSVEIIVKHMAEARAANKKAIMIAAIVGFIAGFLCSLGLPYLQSIIAEWQVTLPVHSTLSLSASYFSIASWCMIGWLSAIIAVNTYEAASLLLQAKRLRVSGFSRWADGGVKSIMLRV